MEDTHFWIGACFATIIWIFLIVMSILPIARDRWREDAIKHGAAEYYIDGKEAKWRWKNEPVEQP